MFLGPEGSATDIEYLRKMKIDRVVVAAYQCKELFKDPKYGISYLYLNLRDTPEE